MPHSVRTFVAIELTSSVRTKAAAVIKRLSESPAKVRWVDDQGMHLTLKFLGEVQLREVAQVGAAVAAATRRIPPFEISVVGVGAFPTVAKPRTLWLGIDRGSEAVIELHDAIERALEPQGFRSEHRRFRPHVTIGRVRGAEGFDELAELIAAEASTMAGVVSVDEVTVFSSQMARGGPEYQVLHTAELRGR